MPRKSPDSELMAVAPRLLETPQMLRSAAQLHAPANSTVESTPPAAGRYDGLIARLGPDGLPPLVIAIGLDPQLLKALDRHSKATRVLAIEPLAADVREWAGSDPAHAWLADGRLTVLVGPVYEGRTQAWKLVGRRALNPPMIVSPRLQLQLPAETKAAKAIAQQVVLGAQSNEQARQRFSGRYLVNTLTNLATIAAEADASALDGRFQGVPALVVGAGPSLDNNLAALRKVSDRALLIAVDTAVRPLHAAGIRPHLVVSVDPAEANARHLQGLPDPQGLWLVAEGSLTPDVFPQFEGRTFIFKVSGHEPWPWLAEQGAGRGTLRAWGSVLTTAFDLALRAGCDPIVFAGADLAYTDGLQYCRNTVYEEAWRHFPTNAERAAVFATYVKERPHVAHRDVTGRDVVTVPHFVQFRDWIVAEATTAAPRRIINATGAGILHGGRMECLGLDDLALPSRPEGAADLRGSLRRAWTDSRAVNPGTRERIAQALAGGAPLPLQAWLEFGGDTATLEEIVNATRSAAERIATDTRRLP